MSAYKCGTCGEGLGTLEIICGECKGKLIEKAFSELSKQVEKKLKLCEGESEKRIVARLEQALNVEINPKDKNNELRVFYFMGGVKDALKDVLTLLKNEKNLTFLNNKNKNLTLKTRGN